MKLRAQSVADVVAMFAIAILAYGAATHAFRVTPRQSFYQSEFGPAVMLATGRGFTNPQFAPGSELDRFLYRGQEAIDPSAAIPDSLVPIDQFQAAHRYLMTAIGLWWRWTSISWSQLAGLIGAFSVMAAVAVFWLARLFVPVIPATVAAAWFASSPLQLAYAPHLRDYVKGSFVLMASAIAVALVIKPLSRRQAALLGAFGGVVIGVGIGFRMDVLIMAPLTLACVALFRGGGPTRALLDKAIIGAALVASLGISSWPVISQTSSGGSNSLHVLLLGYSDWFNPRLKIDPAPYSLTPFYSDEHLRDVLQSFASDRHRALAPMPSQEYDQIGAEMLREWVRHFPADVYTRLLAAVDGVLNLAFDYPTTVRGWPPTDALMPTFEWASAYFGYGWIIGVLILVAAASTGAGRALFALAFVLGLTGYPSLQFDARHYFHLQAISICAIVVLTWHAGAALVRAVRRTSPDLEDGQSPSLKSRLRPLVTAVVILGLMSVSLAGLRAFQTSSVRATFSDVVGQPREKLDVQFEARPDGLFVARWPDMQGESTVTPGLHHTTYLAEFTTDEARGTMAIGVRYAAKPDWTACVVPRYVQTVRGSSQFVFPVYSRDAETMFDGIEMGPEMRRRFSGVYRLSSSTALPMHLQLPSDWRDRRLYQRLISEEMLSPDDVNVGVSPQKFCEPDIRLTEAAASPQLAPQASMVASLGSGVSIGAEGVVIANEVGGPLVEFQPQTLEAGDALVSRIWLQRGSLYVALADHGTWMSYNLVTKHGVSIVTLQPPKPGQYQMVIASGPPGFRPTLRATVDRLGIVPGAPDVTK